MICAVLTEKVQWPSKEPNDDDSEGTYLDATPIIMDFFAKYTL